jgi:uncharacterized membrane protein YphA (DoxX/SURF4 family)
MTGIAYVAALGLAATFAWAAIAKLRAPERTAAGFAGLGLPAPTLLARVVPGVEAGLAVALVVVPVWGAGSALGLLAAFTILLAVNVGRDAPGCNCFGATPTDEPVSWVEVLRNLLLGAAAVIATGAPRPLVPALPEAVVATTVGVLGAVLLGVVRFKLRVGRVWDNQLPGDPAPR